MTISKKLSTFVSPSEEKQFSDLLDLGVAEVNKKRLQASAAKPDEFSTATKPIMAMPDKMRVKFMVASMKTVHLYFEKQFSASIYGDPYTKAFVALTLISHLLKTKLKLEEDDVENLSESFHSYTRGPYANLSSWPLNLFVTTIARSFPATLPVKVQETLTTLKTSVEKLGFTDRDTEKVINKIEEMLFKAQAGEDAVKPTLFLAEDKFARHANELIAQQPDNEKQSWYKLIAVAQKASGGKPSAKFLEQADALIKELPSEKFMTMMSDWIGFASKMKESIEHLVFPYGNEMRTYEAWIFLAASNIEALKGFVWMCTRFDSPELLKTISALGENSFRKIPGKGPAAGAVGNACLYVLAQAEGLEGVAHLSRLKLRIKQTNTQSLIEKYLSEAAASRNITVAEIEDLAVDDFDLNEHRKEYLLDGYQAVLSIQGIGDVQVDWFNPENKSLKAAPSALKENHADELKHIKEEVKEIEATLTTQRDRMDRLFRSQRAMTWSYFTKHYLTHGLLSYLTRDLIWTLTTDNKTYNCIFLHEQWTTLQAEQVAPNESTTVTLWHPALASVEEIRSWREFLIQEKIKQPVKQAFREVYLLTDAESRTNTYSNRMAAHLLKQHQFNSLAKMRSWKYSLLGAYDDGRSHEIAELSLPEHGLLAQFWVNEVNADGAYNETGIWNYVSTDQVRFVNQETLEVTPLASVPPVIFSEVMRDVDLFVGVASVGNDPTWADSGGLPAHRNYWYEYAFGSLNEIAKTRKEILENLVPQMKIASVATIKDKFLIVRGKKRTYKIHIGSTNILMEPNDQYLCIVPDQSKRRDEKGVFLPFEGDNGLSVILSKAILLADDDKITDPTIVSQIDRK